MKRVRIVETIRETSLGQRSLFSVEERRWWGWKCISIDYEGYHIPLASVEEARKWVKRRNASDKRIIHKL